MRTTLKIVLPLIVSVGSVSLVFAGYQVRNQRRILRNRPLYRAGCQNQDSFNIQ